MQNTFLSHRDAGRVGEVDESSHHLRAHIPQRDLGSAALLEASGEHGSEEGTAGGQHHSVNLKTHK